MSGLLFDEGGRHEDLDEVPLEKKLQDYFAWVLGSEFLPDEIDSLAEAVVTIVEGHRQEAEAAACRRYYDQTMDMIREMRSR